MQPRPSSSILILFISLKITCKLLILQVIFFAYKLGPLVSIHHPKDFMLNRLLAPFLVCVLSLSMTGLASAAPSKSKQTSVKSASAKKAAMRKKAAIRAKKVKPPKPSFGRIAGLHESVDELSLKSSVAYVIDQDTQEVLVSKNDKAVLPIASITKLMTGLVIRESNLPMDQYITITTEDIDTEKGSSSRLRPGVTLSRGELLHLALMSSENRAAHALGRTYPQGMSAFVAQMNAKAQQLGMRDTKYAEPTGLSSRNQSSAKDLATLVAFAANDPTLRELSTSGGVDVDVGHQTLKYKSTNRLVTNPNWNIDLQKTGYIAEAGQCLVMQAQVAGRKLVMVFLDSAGKFSRTADAERVRRWIEQRHPASQS